MLLSFAENDHETGRLCRRDARLYKKRRLVTERLLAFELAFA